MKQRRQGRPLRARDRDRQLHGVESERRNGGRMSINGTSRTGRWSRRRWGHVAWALGITLAVSTSGMAAAAPPKRPMDIGGPYKVEIAKVVPGSQSSDFDFHVCRFHEGFIGFPEGPVPTEPVPGAFPPYCVGAEQFPIPADESKDWRWGNPTTDDPFEAVGAPVQITELISAQQYDAGWRFVSATCSPVPASDPYVPDPATAAAEAGGTAMSILVEPPGSTCQFTNRRVAGLTVVKDASIDDDQDFSFTARRCRPKTVADADEPGQCPGGVAHPGGPASVTSFKLDDCPFCFSAPENMKTLDVKAGVWRVKEKAPPAGWFLESITCTGVNEDEYDVDLEKRVVYVKVRWGEFPECVFRNARFVSGEAPLPQEPTPVPPTVPPGGGTPMPVDTGPRIPPGGGTPTPVDTTTTTTTRPRR